ncbi:MAG: DinB family protein [Bacillota bacterium]
MSQLTLTDSIQSIHQSLDQIIQKAMGLSGDILRWNPTEEEWSIMQILCHLEEAVPYWLNEIEQLLESPGKEWGRGLKDEKRLEAVSPIIVDNTSLEDVLNGLAELKPKVQQTLSKLDEEKLALEAPSRNPRFGTKPLSFIVDHLLVEHTAKHLGQIERNLSKANG